MLAMRLIHVLLIESVQHFPDKRVAIAPKRVAKDEQVHGTACT
jgi:hypothetical protein